MRIILTILITSFILFSCTSNVRFTSKNKNNSITKSLKKIEDKVILKSNSTKKNNNIDMNFNIQNDEVGNLIVEYSKNWLGVPYKYGGINEDGIDCSAFVMKVYGSFGYSLPRTAEQQFDFTTKISRELLEEGDLVFFKRRDKIFHVGIYIGQNQLIHASTSKGVIIQSLDDKWVKSNLYSFGRIS